MSTAAATLRPRRVRLALAALAAVLLVVAPLILPAFANQTLVRIGVYAVAVLGLNIVMGYTGQVNLGQIFFVGLGAYVTAYGVNHGWNILLVFAAACAIAGVVGLLVALAAARLGGLAIAMVTIAMARPPSRAAASATSSPTAPAMAQAATKTSRMFQPWLTPYAVT